ncbi:hypothetical protein ACOMHN_041239 [Nucella lapillus]
MEHRKDMSTKATLRRQQNLYSCSSYYSSLFSPYWRKSHLALLAEVTNFVAQHSTLLVAILLPEWALEEAKSELLTQVRHLF